MAEPEYNHFDASHLFQHIQDAEYFDVPQFMSGTGKVHIPQPFKLDKPIAKIGVFEPVNFAITKFMLLEVAAAVLIAVVFIRISHLICTNKPPRGRFWNTFEYLLIYIRDQVARPAIGKHDADKFLPFLWTMFFFVLACNLLGLVPWAGSATAAFGTTAALAVITFVTVVGAGIAKLGPVHFWLAQVPHMDVPVALGIFLKPLIFVLELAGLLIRHFVLAVRLLANIMAGHLVLVVIVTFIAASYGSLAWWGIAPASIVGAMLLSLLELLVAFIQAYIFTFLSALFIGMAVHPH
jgi:F-type H+-transporting ATPase subunit a